MTGNNEGLFVCLSGSLGLAQSLPLVFSLLCSSSFPLCSFLRASIFSLFSPSQSLRFFSLLFFFLSLLLFICLFIPSILPSNSFFFPAFLPLLFPFLNEFLHILAATHIIRVLTLQPVRIWGENPSRQHHCLNCRFLSS